MPRIESVMLANHAEVRDGLLYMLGGGWAYAWRAAPEGQPPESIHLGVVVSVLFDPSDVNESGVWLRVVDEENRSVFGLEGTVQVAEIERSHSPTRRAIVAANLEVRFPHAGIYHILAGLGGHDTPETRMGFRVYDERPR